MICDRCGSVLPSKGFVCAHCGAMMNKHQIDTQKKINEENKKIFRPEYMSEKYGSKREFEQRKDSASYNKIVFIFVALIILFLFIILLFF